MAWPQTLDSPPSYSLFNPPTQPTGHWLCHKHTRQACWLLPQPAAVSATTPCPERSAQSPPRSRCPWCPPRCLESQSSDLDPFGFSVCPSHSLRLLPPPGGEQRGRELCRTWGGGAAGRHPPLPEVSVEQPVREALATDPDPLQNPVAAQLV